MEPTTKIELLLSDVDGTLVTNEKVLTERNRRAVLALKAVGIRFAIASSRPPRGLSMLVEPLELDTPIAGFNGGAYVQPDMTLIEGHPIDPGAAHEAAELISEAGLDVWLFTADEWLLRDADAPRVAQEAHTVGFGPRCVDDFGSALDHASKIVGVTDDRDRMRRAEAEAHRRLGDAAAASRSQDYFLDVTHPEANKGAVVDYLSRHLGIEPAAIMTIGDMPNDVRMFRKSGFSVAMGNAVPDVQAQASIVTNSNNADGFATAVERILLQDPRTAPRRVS